MKFIMKRAQKGPFLNQKEANTEEQKDSQVNQKAKQTKSNDKPGINLSSGRNHQNQDSELRNNISINIADRSERDYGLHERYTNVSDENFMSIVGPPKNIFDSSSFFHQSIVVTE